MHHSDPTHLFVTAPDGLRLHACAFGRRTEGVAAVVCLPGLARTADDFHSLAVALAGDPEQPRSVTAVEYRGRGQSEYDSDPANYSLAVELADLLAVLTAIEVERAVFVGTSRGGILAMLLAAARPGSIAGVVLNDIGPVIEPAGLVRIKSYLGRLPRPKDFEDAADIVSRLFGSQFRALTRDQWVAFAHRTFKEQTGIIEPRYDPKLADVLKGVDLERPLPPLWREFEALAPFPLMVIRGANSDLLSSATVEAMRARRPDLETLEVPEQGHAPLLAEADVIDRIRAFIARC
jgi:pimeloyl-ACP methyl ester carboxylesterase